MTFSNLQLDVDALPRAAELDFAPMASAYPRQVLLRSVLVALPLLAIVGAPPVLVVAPPGLVRALTIVALSVLAVALLWIPLAVLSARVQGYAVREHDLAHRSGIFFRKVVVLPFSRVQHAEVSVGPLQRRFGLASLKVYTAGGSSVDLHLPGLERQRAEDLRETIIARAAAD